ncbi:MAG: PDZ domain-containing protein, partial [Planctomycetes bacterium]|nr:PDZ domain-containing protein [Planctomycetota bacterium]
MFDSRTCAWIAATWIGLASVVIAAPQAKELSIPDFTKGDPIPENAPHDWNLGPTGLRGWMFCDRLVTKDARQIIITKVEKDSPADGQIAVGDVVLGVGGQRFEFDPRTEFGRAITAAESESQHGELRLIRWRNGKVDDVKLALPVRGAYSVKAPYDCSKSESILKDGVRYLAKEMSRTDYASSMDPIPRSLNALAL